MTAVPLDAWEFPIEEGIILARPEVHGLFCLNQSAAAVWHAYRSSCSEEHASEVLSREYGISKERASSDVQQIVASWIQTGLLGAPFAERAPRYDGLPRNISAIAYCRISGSTILLLTNCTEAVSECAPRLDAIRTSATEPDLVFGIWKNGHRFAVTCGADCLGNEDSIAGARAILFQEMVRRAVPGRDWLALLHAAACGRDGRCVILPSASFSGKTTLSARLMAEGFDLYSDDFVGIEKHSQQIPPMPFALAIREGSWAVLERWIPELRSIDAQLRSGMHVKFVQPPLLRCDKPADASALVFSNWERGADTTLSSLSSFETIVRLRDSGFWVAHDPVSIGSFVNWISKLPKLELTYGSFTSVIPILDELLG